MITREAIAEAATRHHTSDFNIAREYAQHLFLSHLYKLDSASGLLFKGGTALRIAYESPRFSEDLDFSSFGLSTEQIESLFIDVLHKLEQQGFRIELHGKSQATSGGYYGEARLRVYEHEVVLEINVNAKPGERRGEYKLIKSDFAPSYGLLILPEATLVSEKIQALRSRKKPRDYYDLYFMLRAGMIGTEVRGEMGDIPQLVEDTGIDFRQELGVFLPSDQQSLVRDFKSVLVAELGRQLGVNR